MSATTAPFSQAKASCAKQGGKLALPTSDDENVQLRSLLPGAVFDRMWMGASDAGHEGKWTALGPESAGGELSYTNWGRNQPDGQERENCAEIMTSGLWNDAPCGHSKAYACSVPQPPRDLTFPCTAGVVAKLAASGHSTSPPPQCKFIVFGADGWQSSTLKQEFAQCQVLCRQLNAQVAEPRNSDQGQFLARILRESGDDSMWIGLAPRSIGPMGTVGDRWKWRGSGDNLTLAASSWAPGQPGRDGHCVSLWPDGTWNVRECGGDARANKVCPCEQAV